MGGVNETGDEYVSLIQMLLDKGADPNTILSPGDTKYCYNDHRDQGTILDQIGKWLVIGKFGWVCYSFPSSVALRNLTIYKRLTAAGSEFSKPFDFLAQDMPEWSCKAFGHEVEDLKTFEDQIDRKF